MGTVLPLFLISLLSFLTFLSQSRTALSAILFAVKHRSRGGVDHQRPPFPGGNNPSTCNNIFVGSWVRDESYPLYQSSSCPFIDPQFNCQLFGRPDTDYQKFRWKPDACDLPRFDGFAFLERMRGRTVMFVGDSLGRNQWESLVCLVFAAVPNSRTDFQRGEPLSTFRLLDYGLSLSFHKAPYLVDIEISPDGKKVLRLDHISSNAVEWRNADVLSFNTGHWWSHRESLQGWDYMSEGGDYYTDMDRLSAFQKGLTTWANWVDANVDRSKTRVFFQSISPTHYNPAEWGDTMSKNCYGETVPVGGWTYTSVHPDQVRILEGVLRYMKNPPYLLDITNLSGLRKDAHPSIYSGNLSPEQRTNLNQSADCSHWCLPGLPDAWNQLFYTALLF